jgi:aspartyl-tRNA(Asn)/glutamyl-tRNA(Gln) amidotransferase subunit A
LSVKDIMSVAGTRTTAASRLRLDAPLDREDAVVVQRLRRAGAVLLGKVNLHEFAMGDPDPDSPFGNVQNPRKVGYYSGSSSSGSGAAVTAGLGVLSFGTDTGGSIRHPASICGVVGLKPTNGLVPNRGVIPVSPQMDCVGPLGRSVADVAAGLAAVAGYDPADPYCDSTPPSDYLAAVGRDVRGLRLGLPTNAIYRFGQPEVLSILEGGRQSLIDLGLTPILLELPRAEETNAVCDLILEVDLWLYHERLQDRAELYGRDFTVRAQRGRQTTAIQYARAKAAQTEIRRLWLDVFERIDVLALPANAAAAPRHGESTIEIDGARYPLRMVTSRFNRVANLVGLAAMAVPIGATADRLPVGIQLVAPPFAEARLIAVGHALEQALGNLPAVWGIDPQPMGA